MTLGLLLKLVESTSSVSRDGSTSISLAKGESTSLIAESATGEGLLIFGHDRTSSYLIKYRRKISSAKRNTAVSIMKHAAVRVVSKARGSSSNNRIGTMMKVKKMRVLATRENLPAWRILFAHWCRRCSFMNAGACAIF